jgi:hypothetical protein
MNSSSPSDSDRLGENRLVRYTMASAAYIGALAAIQPADAAIVLFDLEPDQSIGIVGDPPLQNLFVDGVNLGTGSFNVFKADTFILPFAPTFWFTLDEDQATDEFKAYGYGFAFAADASDNLYNISAGTPIGLGGNFVASTTLSGVNWDGGGTGYVGLEFFDGPFIHFGWAALEYVDNGGATTLTLSAFAFEDTPFLPILAGDTGASSSAVPEPSSVALIALGGLFGLAARRRLGDPSGPVMPERLLHLASGARGLKQLRADKSA